MQDTSIKSAGAPQTEEEHEFAQATLRLFANGRLTKILSKPDLHTRYTPRQLELIVNTLSMLSETPDPRWGFDHGLMSCLGNAEAAWREAQKPIELNENDLAAMGGDDNEPTLVDGIRLK